MLATAKTDGSPQQSTVGDTLDDHGRLAVSIPLPATKWRNIVRQPSVSLTVPDGRVHLVIFGKANTTADGPERAGLSADILAVARGEQ